MDKLIAFLALTLFSLSGLAQTTDTNEYYLENGLHIIVKQDHRAPIVISKICYRVGASYEPNGITGISHALEHMMFKGTEKYPNNQFSKLVAANGGQENAYTSRDYTCYYQKLANNKLDLSFKLEADRMHNLTLPEKEFTKEIQVVMEERRMRTDDNPQSSTYERFKAAAHISSPYHHQTIGWMNDLQNMKINDLKQWYKRWYEPNNATLIVVGDVQPEHVLKLAKQYFAVIPKATITPLKPHAPQKPLGKREVSTHLPAKLPWLAMGYNTPSVPVAKEKWQAYALEVLSGILDGGNSARLPTQLVRKQQIAAGINVGYDLYSKYAGLFTITGTPSATHTLKQLEDAILEQINQVKTTLVSKQELNKVKTQVIASNVYAKDSLFYQAMQIGGLTSVGLPWQEMDDYVKHVQSVTAKQVQQVAQEYLTENRLTVAKLQPQQAGEDNEKDK